MTNPYDNAKYLRLKKYLQRHGGLTMMNLLTDMVFEVRKEAYSEQTKSLLGYFDRLKEGQENLTKVGV